MNRNLLIHIYIHIFHRSESTTGHFDFAHPPALSGDAPGTSMVEVQEAWEEICRKMGPCWDSFSQKVDVPFHDVPFMKKMLILVFFYMFIKNL